MKPIEFAEQNIVYAKDQPEYLPLPAYRTPDGMEATACWGMTWRERIRVLLTGRVYVTLLTFGGPLTPSIVSTRPPMQSQNQDSVPVMPRDNKPVVVDVVTVDCGYGFSGHAVMSDGTQQFHTSVLHPTSEQARAKVTESARQGGAM